METWTCFYNPFEEKNLLRNDYTREEYWVSKQDLLNTLYSFHKEKGLNGVWLEGPYIDCNELIYKYHNAYPTSDILFTIN